MLSPGVGASTKARRTLRVDEVRVPLKLTVASVPVSDQRMGRVGTVIKKGSSRGGDAAEPLVFRYAKQIRKTGKDPRWGARRETCPAPDHNSGQALIDLWLGSPDIGSAVNGQRLSCRRQRLALRAWPDFFNRISLMLPVQPRSKK